MILSVSRTQEPENPAYKWQDFQGTESLPIPPDIHIVVTDTSDQAEDDTPTAGDVIQPSRGAPNTNAFGDAQIV